MDKQAGRNQPVAVVRPFGEGMGLYGAWACRVFASLAMNANARILVVEDELRLSRLLQLELEHAGYEAVVAFGGEDALHLLQSESFDLILLDIMLPQLSGFDVLSRVRSCDDIPVICVTALDATADAVQGLDLGANDYLVKPFDMEELLARIRAQLRRHGVAPAEQAVRGGDIVLDGRTRRVWHGGTLVNLTRREFDLLEMLMRNRNAVLSRSQILDTVWGLDYLGSTNIVDVYIRYLRAKLDEPFGTATIKTIRGIGYSFRPSATL